MRLSHGCGLVLGVALLGACTMQATATGTDATLNTEAEALYADLVQGRDDAIVARLDPAVDAAEFKAQLPLYRSLTAHGPVPEPRVTHSVKTKSTEGSFYEVAQDYTYPDRVVSQSTKFAKQGQAWKVRNLYVEARIVPTAAIAAPAT